MNALHLGSPWFLCGFVFLAVPFLMLLTRSNTRRVIHFSSLVFLRAVTEKASSIIEWKRLLLLAVRLLIIFCLTAAFALPFLNQRGGIWRARIQSQLVFILDNSYSMGYREKDTLFDQAKERVRGLVRENKKGETQFFLYALNEGLNELIDKTTDTGIFLNKLRDCPLSSRSTSFAGLIAQFREKINVTPDIPAKVFIVSDFSVSETQLRTHLESSIQSACPLCSFELVQVQPKAYKNFSIQSISLPPRPFLPNAEESIKVSYQSFGMAGEEVSVNLSIEDSDVASQKIKVSESGKGEFVFRQKFPAPGFFPVKIHSAKDGLQEDNTRYGLITVHDPLRVLVVQDHEYAYPFETPYFYFTQVLESAGENSTRPWIDIAKTLPGGLSGLKLNQYDLIVAADVPSLDTKALTQLLYYLKEDGTVFFSAGKNFENRRDLNSEYLVQFLGGAIGKIKESGEPFYLASVSFEHPLFKIFDYGRRGDLSAVGFKKQIAFTPQEKSDYEVLAWYGLQQPALIEIKKNNGRLLFWTSSLNADWTDFPKHPLYVPFVFELIRYAALRHTPAPQNLKLGDLLLLDSRVEDFSKPVTVRNPKGELLTLYRDKENMPSLTVDTPGFYQWTDSREGVQAGTKRWAVVNIDSEESKPEYLKIESVKTSAGNKKTGSGPAGLEVKFFIYRPFLYAVLALLMIEAWLANHFYKPQWV